MSVDQAEEASRGLAASTKDAIGGIADNCRVPVEATIPLSTAGSDRAMVDRRGNMDDPVVDGAYVSLPLREERVAVQRRVEKTLVRAKRSVVDRTVAVDEELATEQIVVKRVPIGRVVETKPPIREEDGVTIIPIIEEELVLVRRLVLKEEVHLERVRDVKRHVETVVLQREEVTVTREKVAD